MEAGDNMWSVTRARAAIDAGDQEIVDEWLQNAKPEKSVLDDLMQHCLAAKQDHLFALLLQAGASPEKFVESSIRSPLVIVLQKNKGCIGTLKLILDNVKSSRMKRFVNKKDKKGYYPLFLACENGYLECARILIEKGANVNGLSGFDNSLPLMAASEKGDLPIVKLLLENGANVNKASKIGERPLSLAAQKGHLDCVRELIRSGADVNARTKGDESTLRNAVRIAGKHTLVIVQELVAAGADVTVRDWCKKSALYYACKLSSEEVGLYLADQMHKRKVYNIDTSLRAAVERGHTELVQKLLEYGWEINEMEWGTCRRNLLHLAAERGFSDCLAVILESDFGEKLDINGVDGQFCPLTPLHIAIQWSHPNVVELLLKYNADVDWCDCESCSALAACMCTSEPMCRGTLARLLLQHGCNVDASVIPKHSTAIGHSRMSRERHSTLAWALKLKELWMARMVWTAGASAGETAAWTEAVLSTSQELIYLDEAADYAPTATTEDVLRFIHDVVQHPRTLQELCRITIRSALPRPIHQAVAALPLPPNVIDFLNLKELEDIEAQNQLDDEKMRDQKYHSLEMMEDFDLISTTSESDDSEADGPY